MTSTFVFNQYYIDLIKKLKVESKKTKDTCKISKSILLSIKKNYLLLDKSTDEYISFINQEITDDVWNSYISIENSDDITVYDEWIKTNSDIKFLKNVSLGDILEVLKSNYLCHLYLTVFYIFKNDIQEDLLKKIIAYLQKLSLDEEDIETDNENFKKLLKRINLLNNKNKSSDANENPFSSMKDLEDTTIGKIAKDIINDIDITKLKQSINDEGDIFKAIAKPDSGFSELFTSVSQKMASKISNGELSQENIMKDAMKLASIVPGMFGNKSKSGGGGGGGANSMSNMMNMMSMMNSMMNSSATDEGGAGGAGGDGKMPSFDDFIKSMKNKGGGGGGGGSKGSKMGVNNEALKKMATAKKLRAKLNKKTDN